IGLFLFFKNRLHFLIFKKPLSLILKLNYLTFIRQIINSYVKKRIINAVSMSHTFDTFILIFIMNINSQYIIFYFLIFTKSGFYIIKFRTLYFYFIGKKLTYAIQWDSDVSPIRMIT